MRSPIGLWRRSMKPDPKLAAGRAFVRSLNILLKFGRLYGYDHGRTVEQLNVAWSELRTAVPPNTETSLLLGATGSELLLDGVPLEGSPAEKQFAQLLSTAGLASVQFFPNVTKDDIAKFVRSFPSGKAKPAELALQLKQSLEGISGIRVNEVCFVATDSRLKDATSVAAQLAAASLGDDEQFKQMLNDPQKLLELIAAAEGTKGEGGGQGIGDGFAPSADANSGPHVGGFASTAETGAGGSTYSGERPSSFAASGTD